ncbi:hypothetical protein AC579_3274 [Pseudocercospora musae]|uniref:Uncharacterized protein n=1 Tax=Pseudocercospora musae TaxID=113226 RepID=A0A139IDI9_9PEZI|nr:hypothetical protein AC579_3274 [Pseudocercospora musae]
MMRYRSRAHFPRPKVPGATDFRRPIPFVETLCSGRAGANKGTVVGPEHGYAAGPRDDIESL